MRAVSAIISGIAVGALAIAGVATMSRAMSKPGDAIQENSIQLSPEFVVTLWIDPDTACEYLGHGQALTPRSDAKGNHRGCGSVMPK